MPTLLALLVRKSVADVFHRTRVPATEQLIIEYLCLGNEFCRVGRAHPHQPI
jgi:hypothetical protein